MSEAPMEHVHEPFEMAEGHTPVHDSFYGTSVAGLMGDEYKSAGIMHTHAKKIAERGYLDAIFLELIFDTDTFWAIPRNNGNVYIVVKGYKGPVVLA